MSTTACSANCFRSNSMPAPCGNRHPEVCEVLGRKKRKVPADLKSKLDRNERVVALASTVDEDEAAVVVTTWGLWLPGRDRLGWHEIHKATWAGSRLTVVPALPVSEQDGYTVMADDTPVVVALADPDDVPAEV